MQAGCGALGTQRHLGVLFRKLPIVAFNCNEQLCSTSYLRELAVLWWRSLYLLRY